MQHFFQKFQTSIENLNPFPFDLGTHLIFVFFCFLLFVVYIFASKFILRLIQKVTAKNNSPWIKVVSDSLFFQKAISLSFWFILYFLAYNIPNLANSVNKIFFIPLIWQFLRTLDQCLICSHKLYENLSTLI